MNVLQISMGETFGGIEKIEEEYLQHLDNDIKLNILTPVKVFKNDERIFDLNISRKRKIDRIIYAHRLSNFLKEHKYDIVHINSSAFFFSLQVAIIAKKRNVKKVIVHAHSTPPIGKIKNKLIRIFIPLLKRKVDQYLACSKIVQDELFTKNNITKNVSILKNGIDVNKYKFNPKVRGEIGKELNLDKKIVYGNIGRLEKEKNHEMLIDIFYEIHKRQKDSVLLIIGEGNEKNKIEERVKKLNLQNDVLLLGHRKDVHLLLNCIDYLIVPSKHEGFGLSIVEAQANGVCIYASNNIPEDVRILQTYKTFSIEDTAKEIAEFICNNQVNDIDRTTAYKCVSENGFEITDVCKQLKRIYMQM